MSTKKKLIIGLTSLSLVLVLGLAAGLIIFAATRHNVSSNLSASFMATDISGEVTAQYNLEGNSPVDMTVNGQSGGAKVAKFTGNNQTQAMTLNLQSKALQLDKTKSLNFTYNFKNTGDAPYYVKVTYPTTKTNVKIEQIENSGAITNVTAENSTTITIPANGMLKLTIKVSVVNAARNASFNGKFNFNLAKNDPSIDSRPVIELNYEGLDASGTLVSQNGNITNNRDNVNLAGPVTQYQVSGPVLANTDLSPHSRVIIPDTYNGLPVTKIKDKAFNPNINNPFTKIEDVRMGNNITSIGDFAFYSCSGITSITISKSVKVISDRAFACCSGITSIIVHSENTKYKSVNNCMLTKDSKTLVLSCKTSVIPDSITIIGPLAFSGRADITNITIPNNVTSIGEEAFGDCRNLISVTIGSSVTSIGTWAFYRCASLTDVIISESVISIGEEAFWGCGLTNITIPVNVTSIGEGAFDECIDLESVIIDSPVIAQNIVRRSGLLYYTSLIYIKETITDISSDIINYYQEVSSNELGYRLFMQ